MHFYLPRRHCRRLLFPPGLLALAGLLWLGCVYITQNVRLKPFPVLQLTMIFYIHTMRTGHLIRGIEMEMICIGYLHKN